MNETNTGWTIRKSGIHPSIHYEIIWRHIVRTQKTCCSDFFLSRAEGWCCPKQKPSCPCGRWGQRGQRGNSLEIRAERSNSGRYVTRGRGVPDIVRWDRGGSQWERCWVSRDDDVVTVQSRVPSRKAPPP